MPKRTFLNLFSTDFNLCALDSWNSVFSEGYSYLTWSPYIFTSLVNKLISLVTLDSPHLVLQVHLPPFTVLSCARRLTPMTRAPFASTKPGFNQWVALAGHRGCEKGNVPWPLWSRSWFASGWAPLPALWERQLCNSHRTLVVAPSSSDLGVAVHFYKASVVVLFTLKYQEGWGGGVANS